MTKFAKGLIFLNLLLSMMFLGWSIGIYTQRVDWAPGRTLGGELIPEKPGKLAKLKEDITSFVERRDPGEKNWLGKSVDVERAEKHRRDYQEWYANLLHATEDGKDLAGQELKPPFRELVHDEKTNELKKDDAPVAMKYVVDVNAEGKPVKEDELQYLEFYARQLKEVVDQLQEQQKKLEALIEEHRKLTEEVVGVPGLTRGLLGKRDDQLAYLHNCLDEQRYLKPLLNNGSVEIVLLQRRNEALKARIKELNDFAANR